MRISTLVCAYVPDDRLRNMFHRALNSLQRQSRKPDEIVIVLDESHQFVKDTRRYINGADQNIDWKLIVRHSKEGLAVAKNTGLKECTGDYITYCDVDDEWMECKLEVQEKFAKAHVNIDVIATQAWDRGSDHILRPNCFAAGQYQSSNQIRGRIFQENVICHGSVMIKKSALDAMVMGNGPYRDVRGAEDWDLWKRMISCKYKFHNIPERLYVYSLGTSVER